jgi:hypothetical protein
MKNIEKTIFSSNTILNHIFLQPITIIFPNENKQFHIISFVAEHKLIYKIVEPYFLQRFKKTAFEEI